MKKRIQVVFSLVVFMVVLLVLAGCGENKTLTTEQSSAKNENIDSKKENVIYAKFSAVFPATGTQATGALQLGEFIKEESKGNIIMEFYPSSQLGDKIAAMEGMIGGTIEMSEFSAADFSNYDEMWSVFSLPYLWDSGEQAIATLIDPEVSTFLEKNVEQYGMKIIAWQNLGGRSILNSKRTVTKPEDLKGLKIRCMQDPVLAGTINSMGGSAAPMAWSEVYTALQQGTIDGLENSAPVILANGMQEVAKYLSLTEQFIIPDPVVISKSWFDGLSAQDQEAILTAGKRYTEWYNKELWPNAEGEAIKMLKEAGVEVTEIDKTIFKERTQKVIDDFLSAASAEQKQLYELLAKSREKYTKEKK